MMNIRSAKLVKMLITTGFLGFAAWLGVAGSLAPINAGHKEAHSKIMIPKIEEPLNNPFMGWAPWATGNVEEFSRYQPHSLIFSLIDWRIFEPEEGVFDVEALKESMHYEVWADANVKFIIRPVLDYTDSAADEPDMDIPDWLYNKMNKYEGTAGMVYDISYGTGFSPNYHSEILQEAHGRFISKLGEIFNDDPNIAFVQLGSIGHWGEWHTNFGEGLPRMPKTEVTDIYAMHYVDAFPDKKLLMRRPFTIGKENSMGLYDDSFLLSTEKWLQWINMGYLDYAIGEYQPAMPGFWKSSPSGGELGTDTKPEALANPTEAVDWIRRSHTTFLGPSSLTHDLVTEEDFNAANMIRAAMGYRLRVDSVDYRQSGSTTTLTLNWTNDGVAPFYYPWPIVIELVNSEGQSVLRQVTGWDIRKIMPIKYTSFDIVLDSYLFRDEDVKLKVYVMDPNQGVPGVYLAQEHSDSMGRYELLRVVNGVVFPPHEGQSK